MPIYEFYCGACHRVFNFLSRRIDTGTAPACPKCRQPKLTRRISAFAISRSRKEEPANTGGRDHVSPMDDARMERALETMASEAEGLNEDDPRQTARLVRRLFDATGMPVNEGMDEALRRLEAGEDPDRIEQEMGDIFENDPLDSASEASAGTGLSRGRRLLRRTLAPTIDPQLYEM